MRGAPEIFPVHEKAEALRIEFFGDEVESIQRIDPMRGKVLENIDLATVFPGSHYVVGESRMKNAVSHIRNELVHRLRDLRAQNRLLEAQRLEQRTLFDLEKIEQTDIVQASRIIRAISRKRRGEPPPCLLDYFPSDSR